MTRFAVLLLLAVLLAMGVDPTSASAQDKRDKAETLSLGERLPPKIHQIHEELPAWLKKTGNKEVAPLMQKLDGQIKAKKFEDAEKTADSILKIMGVNAPNARPSGDSKSGKSPAGSPEEMTKRLTAKVELVKAGAEKWAAAGRHPAEIIKTMQEKFQPLMEAGKIVEAEAVLDNVLKTLGVDASVSTAVPADSRDESSAEERLLTRVHRIQKELPAWVKKTGKQAEADALMQKLKEQLAAMSHAEAEETADAILEMMGLNIAADTPAERPTMANNSKDPADPFSGFLPQQLVFLAREHIALTPAQHDVLRARVNTIQPRLEELETALKHEAAALKELTSRERLDEVAILAQLNQFLDVERETKQLQVSLGVTIQNLLTAEQQSKLRELLRNQGAVKKLEEDVSKRIMAKVQRINAGAQKWAASGRDPSSIAQAMEENVRPFMDAGRIFEAEAEMDRVLEQLDKDTK